MVYLFLGDIKAAQQELQVHKIDMETNSGRTALMFAAQYGNKKLFNFQLTNKPD